MKGDKQKLFFFTLANGKLVKPKMLFAKNNQTNKNLIFKIIILLLFGKNCSFLFLLDFKLTVAKAMDLKKGQDYLDGKSYKQNNYMDNGCVCRH